MKKVLKVIINADDLGKNHEVNSQIDNALTHKNITSSSILANNNCWEEVELIVKRHPDASFGVHLNLTEGQALTNSSVLKKYGIVDEDNLFTSKIKQIILFPHELQNAIYYEWSAQIETIQKHNITISHIDGHHHVHSTYGLTPVLLRLIEQYHISSVRNCYSKPLKYLILKRFRKSSSNNNHVSASSNNLSVSTNSSTGRMSYLKNIMKGRTDRKKWQRQVGKVAYLTDYFDSYETVISDLMNGMEYKNGVVVELMCHPGHSSFNNETSMLQDRKIEVFFNKIEYISYKDVCLK